MSGVRTDFPGFFLESVGRPLGEGVPLRGYANFRIGGPADYFFEAATALELKSSIRAARRADVPFYVIGGGYNLLFDDGGFRGLIIKNSTRGLVLLDPSGLIKAASGTPLGELVEFAAANGLGGLEFAAGIPGTIGGAVFGNAGAFGQAVGDRLEAGVLLGEDGRETRAPREYFRFAYRHSQLKIDRAFLLEAEFRLSPGSREGIRAKIAENLAVRARKHPPELTACAGSYFKNPAREGGAHSAGYLLEQVGARGLAVGGAEVFPGHCNFLINANDAAARDVLALAAELKKRVLEKFGVSLEEEVVFLPSELPGR
jgi:UDP-N-acetylmuramate dehydrogenase